MSVIAWLNRIFSGHKNEPAFGITEIIMMHFVSGLGYAARGDPNRAIKEFNCVLRKDPKHADAFYSRGNAYRDKDKYDRAINDYDCAIEIRPEFSEAYLERGLAYCNQDNYNRALLDYVRALELNPDLKSEIHLHFADTYLKRAAARDENGREKAIEDCGKAIQFNPNLSNAYVYRGAMNGLNGNFDRAIEDFGHALQVDPNMAEAYEYRGRVYKTMGDIANAKRDFQRAADLGSEVANRVLENLR